MRKQWFGDSRDYAKWNFVYEEALPDYAICYIAMARPDEIAGHIHPKVGAFFDRYKDIGLAAEIFDGRLVSLLDEYQLASSNSYFDKAELLVRRSQEASKVVIFVDPDTGLEPSRGASSKHLRLSDLKRISSLLRAHDKLIVYQHASRSPSWIQDG